MTFCGWCGVARTSRDPPQEPHYRDAVEGPSHVQDEISPGELAASRGVMRADGFVRVTLRAAQCGVGA